MCVYYFVWLIDIYFTLYITLKNTVALQVDCIFLPLTTLTFWIPCVSQIWNKHNRKLYKMTAIKPSPFYIALRIFHI